MRERSDLPPFSSTDRWSDSVGIPARRAPSMRAFGFVLGAGFALVGLALLRAAIVGHRGTGWLVVAVLALGASLGAAGLAVFAPPRLRACYAPWMRLGLLMGGVVGGVILTAVYLAIVTPLGWVMRATGTDPLDRSRVPGTDSYWRPRRTARTADHFRHLS
jgi:hypothetical protein